MARQKIEFAIFPCLFGEFWELLGTVNCVREFGYLLEVF